VRNPPGLLRDEAVTTVQDPHHVRPVADTPGPYAQGCPFLCRREPMSRRTKEPAVLSFRWYRATCPACLKPIDILPPDSIVAEDRELAHRCPLCGQWLATYVSATSRRHPDMRIIESRVAPEGWRPERRRGAG
jgi:hypothetical protein